MIVSNFYFKKNIFQKKNVNSKSQHSDFNAKNNVKFHIYYIGVCSSQLFSTYKEIKITIVPSQGGAFIATNTGLVQ